MNKETLSVSPWCSTVECRTDQDTTITPIISHSDTLPPSLPCQDRQSGSVLHSLHQWLLPLQGNIVNENLKSRQNERCWLSRAVWGRLSSGWPEVNSCDQGKFSHLTCYRLLFANFTSSLLIVNSTLLTYAALALLGLAGHTGKYQTERVVTFIPRTGISLLLLNLGERIIRRPLSHET